MVGRNPDPALRGVSNYGREQTNPNQGGGGCVLRVGADEEGGRRGWSRCAHSRGECLEMQVGSHLSPTGSTIKDL